MIDPAPPLLAAQWWQCFVGQAQQETRANAARLAAALGADLAATPGGQPLGAEDVRWGLGMAMSRKFLVEGQVRVCSRCCVHACNRSMHRPFLPLHYEPHVATYVVHAPRHPSLLD